MARQVLALFVVIAQATPSAGAHPQSTPPGPAIGHSPLKCIEEDQHPHVRAAIAPGPVERRRVYFKAHQYPDWYYIEMEEAELPNHLGILPKPLPGTSQVDYYLYALDAQLQTAQSPQFDPDVERTCRRDQGAWLPDRQASPRITVYATAAGQRPIPPGFAATGIVAFVNADGERLSDDELMAALLAPSSWLELAAAIALLRQGDYAAALAKLEAVVGQSGPALEQAQAHLYRGSALFELKQESPAVAELRQALRLAPDLRLDPDEFPPLVGQTLEAIRRETSRTAAVVPSGPSEPASPGPAGSEPTGSEPTSEPRAKRSVLPYVLGAAGVTGIALVVGGGSDAAPPASPTPLPSATPTPATPSPSPTPPRCGYQARPATQAFPKAGGSGTCDISTSAECTWTAESSVNWIQIRGERSGRGSGRVRFDVASNSQNEQRRGFVRLREKESVRCQVDQNPGGYTPPITLAWSSEILVPGGAGRVVVNGTPSALHGGRVQAHAPRLPGRNRIEAELLSGRSQPGVWRFRIEGGLRGDSLRVERGSVAQHTGATLVFRLRGQAGERVAFSFEMD